MNFDSPILQFYSGNAPDTRNRMIEQIWQQDHVWLEKTHDYIQWLFPLIEGSRFHAQAPILTESDILVFRNSETLRENLSKSLNLMLDFYGLSLVEKENNQVEIILSASFSQRKQIWVHWGNHNYMRITRILKCLRLVGLDIYAQAFFKCLQEIYILEKGEITNLTLSYWQEALQV